MKNGGYPAGGVFVAVDVQYLASSGARAAAEAADIVRHMTGAHRIPDALRRADSLARHSLSPKPRI
jgi:endonuclease V-like protein UPF0215 family